MSARILMAQLIAGCLQHPVFIFCILYLHHDTIIIQNNIFIDINFFERYIKYGIL